MKVFIRGKNVEVSLDKRHFLAKGGEGEVYVKSNTAYKICEPGKMIPDGKFQELSVLTEPHVIRPEDVLLDTKHQPVGYTMRYVADTSPICQLFTKSFRNRNNVQPDQVFKLVRQMQNTLSFIHSHKVLGVDLNELNFLLDNVFEHVYFIDVNSYQTPHYPATAIMESIRDRHCNGVFSEGTDWFSFGIVTFQMLIGIHPYKGRHPNFTDQTTALDERMKHNISIFDQQVAYPKAVCQPFDVIPDVYLQWYRAIFDKGLRVAPPKDLVAQITVVSHVKKIVGGTNLEIKELCSFQDDIVEYYYFHGKEVVITKDGRHNNSIFVNNRLQTNVPSGQPHIALTPKLGSPIGVYKNGLQVGVHDFTHQQALPTQLVASQIMECEDRVYLQAGMNVLELLFVEMNNKVLVTSQVVGTVAEQATQFYKGVAIQNLFDSYYASIFPQSKQCRQYALKELKDYKIVDAKFEGGVLVVIGVDKLGKYDRFVLRFAKDWSSYDVRIQKDVVFAGINFTVLDNGICVLMNEEEQLEIFKAEAGQGGIKLVEDDALEGDMRLTHKGAAVLVLKGNSIYTMKMK